LLALAAIAILVMTVMRVAVNGPGQDSDSSPAGEPIVGGLKVASGSELLGPVLVTSLDAGEAPDEWFALIAVTDNALDVWDSYRKQLAEVYSTVAALRTTQGCRIDGHEDPLCRIELVGSDSSGLPSRVTMRMRSYPDDVSSRYLITVNFYGILQTVQLHDVEEAEPVKEVPKPFDSAGRRSAGDGIAPTGNSNLRGYEVVEGSELLAVWEPDNAVYGIGALVKIDRDQSLARIANQYAEQTPGQLRPSEKFGFKDTAITTTTVASLGGSNSASVWAVDQEGNEADYVFLEVFGG
jgi:hypothetical protein